MIPKMLLNRCEFAKDDCSLNIICPPTFEEDVDEDDVDTECDNNMDEASEDKNRSAESQLSLF